MTLAADASSAARATSTHRSREPHSAPRAEAEPPTRQRRYISIPVGIMILLDVVWLGLALIYLRSHMFAIVIGCSVAGVGTLAVAGWAAIDRAVRARTATDAAGRAAANDRAEAFARSVEQQYEAIRAELVVARSSRNHNMDRLADMLGDLRWYLEQAATAGQLAQTEGRLLDATRGLREYIDSMRATVATRDQVDDTETRLMSQLDDTEEKMLKAIEAAAFRKGLVAGAKKANGVVSMSDHITARGGPN